MAKAKAQQQISNKPKGRSKLDDLALSGSDDDFEIDDGLLKMPEDRAAGSDDDLDEEAVYGLDDSEDEDEESDEDEDDSEEALEEAILRGGKQAQLAKQAQYLQQKLKLQQREDEDEEDEEQQEQQGGLQERLWGANKRAYYQANDMEAASDDEALQQEEEEARQLQAQQAAGLDDEDYGLTGFSGREGQAEPSLEQQLAAGGRTTTAAAAAGGAVEVETVDKDVGALTSEQQRERIMSDAPELLALLDELRGSLGEVRGRIGPLLREVSAGGLATAAGLSYLEAKHLLLLQYCMCIVAYLMIKAEGRSVAGHPVLHRLAQLRVYIEKIRPIDKQLSYQVDKLLRATAKVQASADVDAAAGQQQQQEEGAAAGGGDDALQYRPNPKALLSKVPLVGDTTGLDLPPSDGVYRPPKLNPVAMPEDRAVSNKEMRRIREAQRRAQRSAVMRELAQELAGAPEEVTAELPGMDTAAAVAARQRLEARAAAEEELMLRVPLSKAEAKKLKAQRRAGLSGAGLTDFADDVADLVASSTAAEGGKSGGLNELFGKHKLSQRYGADLATQQQAQLRSGDADILPRKPLHERRAAFDAVAARRAAAAGDDEDEYDYDNSGSGRKKRQRQPEEDEFYAASKAARAGSKAAKKAAHSVPQLEPPLPEPEAIGQRKITYEIEKNRGLTPHRRKDLKNPRKKHRVKFAQAVVRRKGQVQGVRQAPSSARAYAGEATGIKSRVAKSTRLG